MNTVKLTLPFPPTINHYYGHRVIQGKSGKPVVSKFIMKLGKVYRENVADIVFQHNYPMLEGNLKFTAAFYPPNNCRRDIDNLHKALFDALQCAGVYKDDTQIKEMHSRMMGKDENSRAEVMIEVLP